MRSGAFIVQVTLLYTTIARLFLTLCGTRIERPSSLQWSLESPAYQVHRYSASILRVLCREVIPHAYSCLLFRYDAHVVIS